MKYCNSAQFKMNRLLQVRMGPFEKQLLIKTLACLNHPMHEWDVRGVSRVMLGSSS